MTCPHCHAETLDDALFCTNCGTALGVSSTRPTGSPQAPGDGDGPPVVLRRRRTEAPVPDELANTDAVSSVAPSRSPQGPAAAGPATQVNPSVDPAAQPSPAAHPNPAASSTPPPLGDPNATSVNPSTDAAAPSAWDQPDGAATAVHDLSSAEPPRANTKPLPAPAPSSVWTAPTQRAAPRRTRQASASTATVGSGRWARVIAGIVSVWLPVSALIYAVLDQGDLLQRSALEVFAIVTPTRLSWGVWSSTAAPLAWTVSLRALALLAGFGALVILAAWMARNRKAMQVGLFATGATVLAFGVVQLVWLTVGLDLIAGLTVGQEIRQIYVPAAVSIAIGVLLAGLAPVASRSRS